MVLLGINVIHSTYYKDPRGRPGIFFIPFDTIGCIEYIPENTKKEGGWNGNL